MKVGCILLLLISTGKGVPALKGGCQLLERVGPGLCINSMSKHVFQEQPVLLVRL